MDKKRIAVQVVFWLLVVLPVYAFFSWWGDYTSFESWQARQEQADG